MREESSGPQGPLLMTPGPSRLPHEVRQAGAWPMLHHRSEEFSEYLSAVLQDIRPLFGTKSHVLPLHTTGRGGMEAALANLCSPGDHVISCCNGKFGEMWAGFAEAFGLQVHRVSGNWSRSVDPEEVRKALVDHPEARVMTVVHSDTSTGVLNDVEGVARVAREFGVLTLVDCISSLGATPIDFDRWEIDIAVTASQKGLMASTGLCFVAVSSRAWNACESGTLPRSYLDFRHIREALERSHPQTPGSTPVHLVFQVYAALKLIQAEGVETVFKRHRDMASLARTGTAALGLARQCPKLRRLTPTVTGVRAPKGVTPESIRQEVRKRDVLLASGLGPFRDSCFRIGHLGDIRVEDVERTLAVLEDALAELGVRT